MSDLSTYNTILTILFIAIPLDFVWLLYSTAPYGRHFRANWGPCVSSRVGWILMEIPTVVVMTYFFIGETFNLVAYIFLALWMLHYLYRALIYPFRLSDPNKPMPLAIGLSGFIVTFAITYVNAYAITRLHQFDTAWLLDPRFIIGTILFLKGYYINHQADAILRRLRENNTDYQIPHGGLFRYISSPNYFGEIMEWTGWAIATWSLAGTAFALFTVATLVPRAIHHHQWYQKTFPHYPKERRAIFMWIL